MSDFLIVIPTFCEELNLPVILPRLFRHCDNLDVLIIDDNSPDGTVDVVSRLQNKHPNLFLMKRDSKLGVASAYVDGYKWGIDRNYKFFGQMDADMSHRVRDLSKLMYEIKNDPALDLVIGSRWVEGGSTENWPIQRILLSKFGNWYIKFWLKLEVKDSTAGFRIYSKRIVQSLDLATVRSKGFSFQVEMLKNVKNINGKTKEIPIVFREREFGNSKISKWIIIEAFWYVTKVGIKNQFMRFIRAVS